MDEVSVDKSLEYYLTALSYLDEKYINGSDEDLKYYILEELDADNHTFLHYNTVDLLIKQSRIPKSIKQDTEILRNLIINLIEGKRKLHEIRFDFEWIKARVLAKKILTEIEIFRKVKNL